MLSLIRFQTLRSLRHRNFRLLLIGALLSNAGDFMQNVAQSWLVWQLTRSALLLGIVGFFDSIPRLFLGAIGGAIADRVDRRKLLIVTQTLGMLQATASGVFRSRPLLACTYPRVFSRRGKHHQSDRASIAGQ